MSILLLDNFDSFTYNLKHYLEALTDTPVTVCRNNAISVGEVKSFQTVILSPGPGLPADAGIMDELIKTYRNQIPILGVCLGMQAIGECYGGKLFNLPKVLHGVVRNIKVIEPGDRLFRNIPTTFESGRYHSWVIDKNAVPDELKVTAVDENGEVMAISHVSDPVSGVQFHPESIMTPVGITIIINWLDFCGIPTREHIPLITP
jgi:anthranilate synthase component II